MASLENLLKKSGSGFSPDNSQLELSVLTSFTKVEHWILWPLDQKSIGATPHPGRGEEMQGGEK